MTLPYLSRFLCLALGAFFVIHTAATFAVCSIATRVVRYSVLFEPNIGARFVLGLRLFPAMISLTLVLAVFAPSYLLFEPKGNVESIGLPCVLAAVLGAVLLGSGLLHGTRAMLRSGRYLRQQEDAGAPVILVAGLLRPRLVVSSSIRELLNAEELEAALLHEQAHCRARDNLKRFLISMCPTGLPLCRGLRTLEAGWQRLIEWAADDCAAQASAGNALALASALIRVGRLRSHASAPLVTWLLADGTDLRTRVERLIEGPRTYRRVPIGSLLGSVALLLLSTIALSPGLLPASHQILEAFAH